MNLSLDTYGGKIKINDFPMLSININKDLKVPYHFDKKNWEDCGNDGVKSMMEALLASFTFE